MLKSVCLLSVLACAPCAQAGELTETAHVCPADAIRKDCRPAEKDRLFHSKAVEAQIRRVQSLLTNSRLVWMFTNCFPNTLDTTVHFRHFEDGRPDTFVYTGDIHAMWLRDSEHRYGLMYSWPMKTRTERNAGRRYQPSVDVH